MLSWNEILQKYVVRHSDRVKTITKPLLDHLRILGFYHMRIDYLGHLIWLGNVPDGSEYYVDQKAFIDDPCMKGPNFWKSGYSLLETIASESFNGYMAKANSLFNFTSSWIILSKREFGFVEIFGFIGESGSPIEKIYLNHSNLLKAFAGYFKKEMQPIIRQMEEDSISLADLKGRDFFADAPSFYPTIDSAAYRAFLGDCGMRSQLKKVESLSKRERQCLKLFLLGKSAKETAIDLSLSPRTIEFYFENIKNKLACRDKASVFSFGRELENLGLL